MGESRGFLTYAELEGIQAALKGFLGKWRKIIAVIELATLAVGLALLYYYGITGDSGFLAAGAIMLASVPLDALILYYYMRNQEAVLKGVIGSLLKRFKPRSYRIKTGLSGIVLSMDLDGKWLVINYTNKKARVLCIDNPAVENLSQSVKGLSISPKRSRGLLAGLSCKTTKWEGRSRYRVPHPAIDGVAEVEGYSYYAEAVCPSYVPESIVVELAEKISCKATSSLAG